ncbi:MAG: serine/threonine protein kinase, partial [Chloroflexi bacterium]|nr:serine/threonine protein kinase [Chloroflexota bacterium]
MSSGLEGKTLGQYQLTERLGKGGMAEVYKAYQPSLDRFVAIKVLHAYFAEEQDFRNRFQREARAVARLRHTNIVQIYDFGAEGDIYYMAMEFLDGGTLKQRLRESVGFMPRTEVLRIVERVAMALDYAHARGIYHRDVKPANIMLTTDNQVILTDFGLAKMAEGSQYTRSGLSVGTPEYMAPEQGQGLPVDHRADVYSLGVVLYELLTGQLPYTADTPVAIIFKHIKDPLPLPRTINTELSESFERVVLKALAKSPDDRFQSAGELATALRQAMIDADEDLPTPPPSPMSETHIATPALPAP